MVKVWTTPAQVPPVGVTVMVATSTVVPALVATKELMFPVPLAARPIDVLSLVHVKPVAVPLKLTADVAAPLHTTWSVGSMTVGIGSTVIVNV